MNTTRSISTTLLIITICSCLSSIFISSATAADTRFQNLADGTVQDQKTGLIWAASDNGTGINWSDAGLYCENFSGGGHNDWRMPTSSELTSLYGNREKIQGKDYSQSIDVVTTLIRISGPYVWTARRTSKNMAMAFGFNYGVAKRLKRGTGGTRRALPVRTATP